jgi:DNA-binding beta-propeller fold protein YncE
MRWLPLALLLLTAETAAAQSTPIPASRAQSPAPGAGYHVARTVPVGGTGFWDYLAYDGVRHRVFLSHATQVEVVDDRTGRLVGRILGTPGVHGIALAQELGRGFVSNGRDSSVTIFDLATLRTKGRVRVTGRNPDAILYDSVSRRVLTFNGGSAGATALDAATGRVVGTVALGGKPEFAVADGRGGVYVNNEDRGEIIRLDAATLAVRARWPMPGCQEPTGLALDRIHGRLFSTCSNGRMTVVDAGTGRVVAVMPIGQGVDGCGFDPGTGLAFASNGEGTVTVIREEAPDSFRVTATVVTRRGARTMALDPATHRLFTVTAELGPPPPQTPEQPHPRPSIVPGTFTLLVLEP